MSTQGYWGPVTAGNDWCEPNYQHSFYIAETWNTITNFWFFLFGIHGMYAGMKRGDDVCVVILYALLTSIGVGSSLFHGTLTRWGQQSDELPMILGGTMVIYCVMQPEGDRFWPVTLGFSLIGLVETIAYFTLPFEWFLVNFFCIVCVIYWQCCARATTSELSYLAKVAAIAFIVGLFVFWLPEQALCKSYPFIDYLKLHTFWHFCSAYGGHCFLVFVASVRRNLPFYWKWGFVPLIGRGENAKQA